ncbi:MAG: choice-of-anchor J domain-containing protein, partial [Chitinophagaceae bacterium]|nr:choice-of-anchor J domain-containing protein [Chitinophagaceae bacterium]
MKKLLLAPALLLAMSSAKAQLALQNFNAAGIPAGWTMINVDGKVISSALNTAIVSGLATNAWMKWPVTTTDSVMITTSLFTPAGTCDRWLVTPTFTVTSVDMLIAWYDNQPYSPAGLADNIEVWVSTTGGTTAASFTTKLGASAPSATTSKKRISLAAFNGQSIRVGFRSTATNAGVVGIDNVQTEVASASTDMQLATVTPASGSLASYNNTGSAITIGGSVSNKGTSMISSYKVNYKVGTGAVVTETKTPATPILSLGSANFTFTATVPAPAANTSVKVWVEIAGDALASNDTLRTNIAGYTTKPTKKILAEEATGTWCQWCPRGAIYMD